jgi:Fe-S cluster biogenesis protein NfuA
VSATRDKVVQICADIIGPIVRADGGELFVVSIEPDCVILHLAGKCSGCPGSSLTSTSIIEPAIHAVAPGVRVIVTSGFHVPPGASAIGAAAGAKEAEAR